MTIIYIDPGTGSMLISAAIAMVSVAFFMLKGLVYRKFSINGSKGDSLDPDKKYGLVFYSEGKQYWNVFRPLLEESSKRLIPVTYLTSDKDDPALQTNIEGVESIYIGSGRESFFVLNRLNAKMVVMTTPGIDVLEIKRSKDVDHYSHITHALGSIAGYKAYSTDYFDSVLLGGEGDERTIRELEVKRNLSSKKIEVIGHTYLDVLREKLLKEKYEYSMFKDKRTTVLLSPTWGNHGLLTKYGAEILEALEESGQFNVIIRPHPQSFISEHNLMEELMSKFPDSDYRVWDRDRENLKAMSHADIMISDFSGIIFDFFTLFKKPILTLNEQYEKRGRDAMDLDEDPWDIQSLNFIGKTIGNKEIENLPEIILETINEKEKTLNVPNQVLMDMDKYPNESAVRGLNFIELELSKLSLLETEPIQSPNINKLSSEMSYSYNGNLRSSLKQLVHPNMLFQMFMGLILLITYTYAGIRLLPNDGLNVRFLTRIYPVLFILGLPLLFMILIRTHIDGGLFLNKKREKFSFKDFILTALPMTPIIQYIVANQDILSFYESAKVFGYFLILTSFLIAIVPWLMSTLITKNLSISITISFLFIILNMASFGLATSMKVIALVMFSICFVIFIALYLNKKSLVIIISLIFFVTNFASSIISNNLNNNSNLISPNDSTSIIGKFTTPLEVKKTPDIFILVYDSYENEETLNSYGYDNSAQMEFLLDNDFTIYDGTYSYGASSLISMGYLLNPEPFSTDTSEYRKMISGDGSTFKVFEKNGYQMNLVGQSDYLTKGFESQYDFTFPNDIHSIDPHKIIINAILEGEFRFDVDFSTIGYSDYLDAKEMILSQSLNKPEFLYSHGDFPGHSQNSGVLLPNETELHLKKLETANQEMQKDIEDIRSKNRDAIVIIAGDHGPYLTKNGVGLASYETSEIDRLDIQDRYGAFLAISWPDPSYSERYDIKLIQDVIPAVISYMYEDDSLFDATRMDRTLFDSSVIGGANVIDGIIHGGVDDGKPLFENNGVRHRHSD